VHLPARFLAGLRQRLQEILPVNIIHENILASAGGAHSALRIPQSIHSTRIVRGMDQR
jgi:hypothetical protein